MKQHMKQQMKQQKQESIMERDAGYRLSLGRQVIAAKTAQGFGQAAKTYERGR